MSTEADKQPQVPEERAIEPVADTAAPDAGVYERELAEGPSGGAGDDDAQPEGRQPIRSQVSRLEIGERFSKQRRDAAEQIGFTGSHADLTTLAGRLTQEQPDEPAEGEGDPPAAAAAPDAATEARESGPSDSQEQPAAAPRTFKVKVRHEEKELTEDELVAAAQKSLAGDDYLGEARTILEEVKRAASSRPHQDGKQPATTERTDEPADPPHQEDEDRALAERLQFGTTEEATEVVKSLRSQKVSPDDVRKVLYDDRRNADLDTATRAYETFQQENAEMFGDPRTRGALTEQYLDEVRKDLKGLGYTDDRIPKSHDELREHHRFHRIQGKKVRDTATLLADSKQAVETWKSGSTNPAPKPSTVAVNLDRTERRQAIPHQPARAAVPPQAITSPKPVQSARSEAVKDLLGRRRRLVIT